MIIWLASYPKSGNTYLRSFLSTYFFSKDGNYSFDLLKNIRQYPKSSLFFNLGINIKDKHEVAKNHLKVQSEINKYTVLPERTKLKGIEEEVNVYKVLIENVGTPAAV